MRRLALVLAILAVALPACGGVPSPASGGGCQFPANDYSIKMSFQQGGDGVAGHVFTSALNWNAVGSHAPVFDNTWITPNVVNVTSSSDPTRLTTLGTTSGNCGPRWYCNTWLNSAGIAGRVNVAVGAGAHELGHCLGLSHHPLNELIESPPRLEPGQCGLTGIMYKNLDTVTVCGFQGPQPKDIDTINVIYN